MVNPERNLPARLDPPEHGRITRALLDVVSHIPPAHAAHSDDPQAAARRLGRLAARRAALTAGTLALPPGPLGWITVLPELLAIWRIQAQLVSDIAASFGREAALGREQMLWCLFRHTAAQALRDVVVRMGDRLLFRRASQAVVERIARQLGMKLGQRALGAGVGAYAYADTRQVAATATALFAQAIDHVPDGGGEPDGHAVAPR